MNPDQTPARAAPMPPQSDPVVAANMATLTTLRAELRQSRAAGQDLAAEVADLRTRLRQSETARAVDAASGEKRHAHLAQGQAREAAAEIAALRQAGDDLRGALAGERGYVLTLQQEVADLHGRIDAEIRRAADLGADLAGSRAQEAALRHDLDRFLASRSWRITRPLRALSLRLWSR